MSLKESLKRQAEAIDLKLNSYRVIRPVKCERSAAAVEARFGLMSEVKGFEKKDLDESLGEVAAHWRANGSLEGLHRRLARRLPWLIFYPSLEGGILALRGIEPELEKFLSRISRSGQAATIFHLFVRHFPRDRENIFEMLISSAKRFLDRKSLSKKISTWKECNDSYYLFHKNGPERLGRELFFEQIELPPASDHRSILFKGELYSSKFLREATLHYLKHIRNALTEDCSESSLIDRFREFMEPERGQIRFTTLLPRCAETFLLPFSDRNCPEELRTKIQSYLIEKLGHPNMASNRWVSVEPKALAVIKRWIVGQTLEDFFRIIDESALDVHWRYRKAFWQYYHDLGIISDAWVVLGREAEAKVKVSSRMDDFFYGTFARDSGAQKNHSALILQVQGIIFAEWSHSGACRAWFPGRERIPQIGAEICRNLKSNTCDESFYHHGSMNGTWQNRIGDWIHLHTGIPKDPNLNSRSWMTTRTLMDNQRSNSHEAASRGSVHQEQIEKIFRTDLMVANSTLDSILIRNIIETLSQVAGLDGIELKDILTKNFGYVNLDLSKLLKILNDNSHIFVSQTDSRIGTQKWYVRKKYKSPM